MNVADAREEVVDDLVVQAAGEVGPEFAPTCAKSAEEESCASAQDLFELITPVFSSTLKNSTSGVT